MNCEMRRGFLLAAISTIAVLITGSLSYAAPPPPPTLPQLRDVGIDQKLGALLPLETVFRDESGHEVRLGQYFDGKRPVILTLVYFKCPMLCTLVLNDSLRAMRGMRELSIGPDYQVVTVSFDPREKPPLAKAKHDSYVREYGRPGAETGWHFLTGDEEAIKSLTNAVGFRYKFDEKAQQYIHPSGIFVLTPTGRVARYFFGLDYAPKDLRLSMVEASGSKIGSPTDQALLFCFHYDPSTGRYSLAVLKLVKFAGVLTVLGMALMMGIFFARDRRRQKAGAGRPQNSGESAE